MIAVILFQIFFSSFSKEERFMLRVVLILERRGFPQRTVLMLERGGVTLWVDQLLEIGRVYTQGSSFI